MQNITINGVDYVRADSIVTNRPLGPEVIIRTYSAGVHIGTIISREGREVKLANARRLWSWAGAFTLNAVAAKGVDRKESRISIPIEEITLLEVIEIIPVSSGVDLSTTEK
jgi:hypothetical protein